MRWPPFRNVFFDCDSTLTTVEGIDVLAEAVGKGWRVATLTRAAMDGQLDLEDIYARRLRTIHATRAQIKELGRRYKKNVVEDARGVIGALHHLGHNVHIVSGGLEEPVRDFASWLGVPGSHVHAVPIEYDQLSGDWWLANEHGLNPSAKILDYEQSPLTVSDGKAKIIAQALVNSRGRSLLIGDGVSDLLAATAVDLFAGFGGVEARLRVELEAPLFTRSSSLAPLLLVAAGPHFVASLQGTEFESTAARAFASMSATPIRFNDERRRKRFEASVERARSAFHPRSD